MDEVNPVWFKTQADGTLRHDAAARDPRWLAAMAGADIVPVVRPNKHDEENAEAIASILASRTRSEKLLGAIDALFDQYTFMDGIEIDYEGLEPSTRDSFSRFVEALEWDDDTEHASQDWERLGAAADRLKIMAYDYHHSTSDPGAVALMATTGKATATTKPRRSSMTMRSSSRVTNDACRNATRTAR